MISEDTQPGCTTEVATMGWLQKKTGGKTNEARQGSVSSKSHYLEKWDTRFFVLPHGGTHLLYYVRRLQEWRGHG